MMRRHRAAHALIWLVGGPLVLLTLVLLVLERPAGTADSMMPLDIPGASPRGDSPAAAAPMLTPARPITPPEGPAR